MTNQKFWQAPALTWVHLYELQIIQYHGKMLVVLILPFEFWTNWILLCISSTFFDAKFTEQNYFYSVIFKRFLFKKLLYWNRIALFGFKITFVSDFSPGVKIVDWVLFVSPLLKAKISSEVNKRLPREKRNCDWENWA